MLQKSQCQIETQNIIMKAKTIISTLLLSALAAIPAFAQQQETGERKDTLDATVKVERRATNFLSKGKDIRTEVISAAGLCKMACCNLAESFENSASVSVSYADAVTGARQIKLLGQSGIYTQMLDENRPVMRGLSAPFGLTYVPSQWLESIQIGKGVPSVINGVESMTGQINLEHRKPTDEKPLYIQASVMDDTKTDINIASSLQLDEMGKWSTVILAHADANFMDMDHNEDGFLDDPRSRQFSLANRWLYYGLDGTQVRFGFKALVDDREGGRSTWFEDPWRTKIQNRDLNAYLKVGTPLNEDNSRNIAAVADYSFQRMNSTFGLTPYNADQHSAFVNLLYQDTSNEHLHYTVGISDIFDLYNEALLRLTKNELLGGEIISDIPLGSPKMILNDLGVFGEATFKEEDRFTAILGVRGDYYGNDGFRVSPRATIKWMPHKDWVFRANGGRGIRYSNPVIDNIGILSTSKSIYGLGASDNTIIHPLEDSWTIGGNLTWYVPFDKDGKTYISLDYFHSNFTEQLLVDNTSNEIHLYLLSDVPDSYSYTNNFQIDFSTEPVRGLTLTFTGRYTDARQTLVNQESDIKPMTSLYKAVFNAQYATRLNKWIFDFTASLNGPCKLWDFMKDQSSQYKDGYSPAYPLVYAQITRRFKGFDIYAGVENLTGFTQKNPIIGYLNPWQSNFDASCIWGPIMAQKFYAGLRFTLWK